VNAHDSGTWECEVKIKKKNISAKCYFKYEGTVCGVKVLFGFSLYNK
jgi:hypothetical protein